MWRRDRNEKQRGGLMMMVKTNLGIKEVSYGKGGTEMIRVE